MTLHYKTSELTINRQRWVIREFVDRDQFPTAQEKIDIGAESWGSDVLESLWPLSGVLWPSGVALAELADLVIYDDDPMIEIKSFRRPAYVMKAGICALLQNGLMTNPRSEISPQISYVIYTRAFEFSRDTKE